MDILKKFKVSYYPKGKDVKKSLAEKIGKLFELAELRSFGGSGKFQIKKIIFLRVRLIKTLTADKRLRYASSKFPSV